MGLSTHILDTHLGKPAAHVVVALAHRQPDGRWLNISEDPTDADGRCKTLLGEHPLQAGDYKIRFDVGAYFRDLQQTALYPTVEIVFTVADPAQHYHIPLLLTANGYSTYRGS